MEPSGISKNLEIVFPICRQFAGLESQLNHWQNTKIMAYRRTNNGILGIDGEITGAGGGMDGNVKPIANGYN